MYRENNANATFTAPDHSDNNFYVDSVHTYLKEISRVPLLTASQEVELAKKIEAGKAADCILNAGKTKAVAGEKVENYVFIKGKGLKDLKEMSLEGKDAHGRMVEANLRLVVSVAKHYIGRGLSFLDLIQEGNLGVIKAVDKYDYHKGFRFSTYATWWIRQTIERAIADQTRTIRLPVHMVEMINRIKKVSGHLTLEYGREPVPGEIAEKLNMSEEQVVDALKSSLHTVSLYAPAGRNDDDDGCLSGYIYDDKIIDPESAVEIKLMQKQVAEALSILSKRERSVLILRFGLRDGKVRTLEDVGELFGVTRERIRQIETKALRKLRLNAKSSRLCRAYV